MNAFETPDPVDEATADIRTRTNILPTLIRHLRGGFATFGAQQKYRNLAVELFRLQSGIEPLQVPYKGGGPAVTDLVGGQTSFMFASPLEVMPNVKAARLNVIAATSS